ncbi:MAG: hypothetical protein ACRCYR_05030 [Phycicoccus sp.]
MDPKMLAAGLAGFLLGGFVVSLAATLDDDGAGAPHGLARPAQVLVLDTSSRSADAR